MLKRWWGTGNAPQAETDLAGNVLEDYVFLNRQRIARRDATTKAVHFYFSDHLGSHSVVENAAGTTCEQDIDYYPYGGVENDYCSGSGATQNYKFTGKERDSESGLDNFGARFYGSSLGRFTSTDPQRTSVNPSIPQTWNRYSYTLNNPLKYVDPDGKCSAPALGQGQVGICVGLYISTPRLGDSFPYSWGHGDNRGPVGNDKNATFRYEVKIVVGPQSTTVSSQAGISKASPPGVDKPTVNLPGNANANGTTVNRDSEGNTNIDLKSTGTNGFAAAGIPGAPAGDIVTNLNLVVTADGKVGIEGGERTSYPSVEVYKYEPGKENSPTEITTIPQSSSVDDLQKPLVKVERVEPK